MRPFQFRAAAALMMRRKQEDVARQRLAAAEIARQRAQDHADTARQAAETARQASVAACLDGAEGWRLGWHQSWMTRTRIEAEAGRRAAVVSAEAVGRATAAVQLAYRHRRALERLREKAWHRYRLEAARRELHEMNELATLRHQAQPDED